MNLIRHVADRFRQNKLFYFVTTASKFFSSKKHKIFVVKDINKRNIVGESCFT